MASSLRVLAVCTHNRTRSVLISSLFEEHARRQHIDALVLSAGFSDGGDPPTDQTVRLLAARGIDVRGYRSLWMGDKGIMGADLIVTARQRHVVAIAGRWNRAFEYTFTLPELVERGNAVGPRGNASYEQWLAAVNSDRPEAVEYLDSKVGEIEDPTGRKPSVWSASFAQIDDLASQLAALLA